MTFPKRGDLYLVEFDPARGHEIQKTRPALVIQNDIGNQYSPVTIVAAMTSKLSPTPRGSPKTGQSGSPENRPVVDHHPGH
jgi:mRNA-degrading endonuclease toxin of MazEF toxin-antitoxin module